MTKIMTKYDTYCLAIGVGSESVPSQPLSHHITAKGLTLYYKPVPKDQFNEESLQELTKDIDWVKREVLSFSDQQVSINNQSPIIPFRFGTVYSSEEKMGDYLSSQHKLFSKNLNNINDKTEWGVKVYVSRTQFRNWLKIEGDSSPQPPKSGSEFFEMKKKEYEILEQEDAQLNALIMAVKNNISEKFEQCKQVEFVDGFEPKDSTLKTVASLALLIDRKQQKRLNKLTDKLNELYQIRGIVLRLSGPWPAFNFVTMEAI